MRDTLTDPGWYIATVYLTYVPPRVNDVPRRVVRLHANSETDFLNQLYDTFPSAAAIEVGPVSRSKVQG